MAETIRFEKEIEKLITDEPFVPFTIVLSSGSRYKVPGPLRLAMGRGVFWVVPLNEPAAFFRRNQIVSVETGEDAPPAKKNGRRKHK